MNSMPKNYSYLVYLYIFLQQNIEHNLEKDSDGGYYIYCSG